VILGVGVDAFVASRLAKLLHEDPDCATQLFTPEELAATEAPATGTYRLAMLFAIKEATFKALAPPPFAGAHWREVAVRLGGDVPLLRLTGNLGASAEAEGPLKLHVATSALGDLVVALVIAEKVESGG
jgi:phosphopantetheine--protein transferase-like protein